MPYRPIISPADLISVAKTEVINKITRDNEGIVIEAIDAAIGEVRLYLDRFDPVQIFGDIGLDVAATFHDATLTRMIKVIAIWHLIGLSNVNIDYEKWKDRYKVSIDLLKRIQEGKSAPMWPLLDTAGADIPEGNDVFIISNPKRENY